MAERPRRPGAADGAPADELVLTAAARSLRRALGPTAWAVLEELTAEGSPDADGDAGVVVVATTLRDLAEALGMGRDAVARALQALALAGWVRSDAARGAGGRFGAGRYLVASNPALRRAPAAPTARRPRAALAVTPPSSRDQQLSLRDLSSPATVVPRPTATTTP